MSRLVFVPGCSMKRRVENSTIPQKQNDTNCPHPQKHDAQLIKMFCLAWKGRNTMTSYLRGVAAITFKDYLKNARDLFDATGGFEQVYYECTDI